ncbi:MAG: metallophosphoesterase [Thermoplasmata archaeon]
MSAPSAGRSPADILRMSAGEADDLIGHLEERVPHRPPLAEISAEVAEEAVVFGDSHGDWRATAEVVRRFREGRRSLIGLGDYIDRAPADCGAGSVANALFLLGVAAEAPDRVWLIQGNHETTRRIPVRPHSLPSELANLWGPDPSRYDRILELLARGPIAARTPSGAYLAHAGFPRGPLPTPWSAAFDAADDDRLAEVVWAECDVSAARRGAAPSWGNSDLDLFLRTTGLRIFLRGHDPDLTAQPLFEDRCMTLHTCRLYGQYGGVISAMLPLRSPVRSVRDLTIDRLKI